MSDQGTLTLERRARKLAAELGRELTEIHPLLKMAKIGARWWKLRSNGQWFCVE